MQTRQIVRTLAAVVAVTALALTLMGAAWRASPAPASAPAMLGVPTGEYVNGVEVQRLPSITVTARRSDAQ